MWHTLILEFSFHLQKENKLHWEQRLSPFLPITSSLFFPCRKFLFHWKFSQTFHALKEKEKVVAPLHESGWIGSWFYISLFHYHKFTDEVIYTYNKSLKDMFPVSNYTRICSRDFDNFWCSKKEWILIDFAYSNWRKQIFRQLSFRRRMNRLKTESSGMAKFCLAFAQFERTRDMFDVCRARLWGWIKRKFNCGCSGGWTSCGCNDSQCLRWTRGFSRLNVLTRKKVKKKKT